MKICNLNLSLKKFSFPNFYSNFSLLFYLLPGETATEEDNNSIAVYFDKKRQNLLAGKFYMLAGHYTKALGHLTRCPVTDTGESIELCIQTVS